MANKNINSVEEVKNKQVIFRDYVTGPPKESDFYITTSTIKLQIPPGSDAILVKNLFLSADPTLQFRMRTVQHQHLAGYQYTPGSPINGFGVAKVVDSGDPNFSVGDLIWGTTGWEEYSLIQQPQQLFKIQHTDVPLSFYTGILGMAGITAYALVYEIFTPRKGDRIFVTAASGAVGQLIGQYCKLMGCYVVGSAGNQEKVDLLKNKLGFDHAFNYKQEHDFDVALKRYFPEGIDIYYEQVGGKMLDAVLGNMKVHGCVASCGMISQYNIAEPETLKNVMQIVVRRLTMKGFTHRDHHHLYPKLLDTVLPYIREKKVVYVEDIVEGLENGPAAFVGLFSGRNFGKQVAAVAHE
ncbi:hypothetical protein QN277_004079 [Acacia crassicarpa]|uniref:Enoyl reductase (ER) domain-containing protein n=1 Tax=Acacia crassicarpa TaxID=499986 RepID=A0AAE1MI13_9FABA|nr:hypothetical protein QN277_004079 [Acacia crassicarpa]